MNNPCEYYGFSNTLFSYETGSHLYYSNKSDWVGGNATGDIQMEHETDRQARVELYGR
jgi:hypothetical protein